MSFLLQKRRGGGMRNRNQGISSNHSRSTTASLLSGTRGNIGSRTISSGGGSQQLMIHRPQQQVQDKVPGQVVRQSEGMISMEEVMEDLRVLEQQQRESQRLLTSIKLTKQHKMEQLSQAEQQLAIAKYANGENRAMLSRYRQILSQKTRELGSLKIRRANGSTDLKRLDIKLRKTLATAERLRTYSRKINVNIISLKNTVALQEKKKYQMNTELNNVEMKRDDARHREQLLVKSITEFRTKSNTLSDEILRTRQNTGIYEMDLANAKQMEASTKYRVESISAEIKSEGSRHLGIMTKTKSELDSSKSHESDMRSKIDEMKSKIKDLQSQLEMEIEKSKQLQSDEDVEPNGFSFEVEKIRERCDAEESRLAKEKIYQADLKGQIDKLAHEVDDKKSFESDFKLKISEFVKCMENERLAETKRREDHRRLLGLLEEERSEVKELKKSVDDLTAQKAALKREEEAKITKENEMLEAEHQTLNELKARIDDKYRETECHKSEFFIAQNELAPKVEMARAEVSNAESISTTIQCKLNCLRNRDANAEAKDEFEEEKASYESNHAAIKAEIEKIIVDYPSLDSMNRELDQEDIEAQISSILSDLREKCRTQIFEAHKEMEEERKNIINNNERRGVDNKRVSVTKSRLTKRSSDNSRKCSDERLVPKKTRAERETEEAEVALLDENMNYSNKSSKNIKPSSLDTDDEIRVTNFTAESNVTPERPTKKKSVTFSFDENTYYTQLSDGTSIVSKRKQHKRRSFEDIDREEEIVEETEKKSKLTRTYNNFRCGSISNDKSCKDDVRKFKSTSSTIQNLSDDATFSSIDLDPAEKSCSSKHTGKTRSLSNKHDQIKKDFRQSSSMERSRKRSYVGNKKHSNEKETKRQCKEGTHDIAMDNAKTSTAKVTHIDKSKSSQSLKHMKSSKGKVSYGGGKSSRDTKSSSSASHTKILPAKISKKTNIEEQNELESKETKLAVTRGTKVKLEKKTRESSNSSKFPTEALVDVPHRKSSLKEMELTTGLPSSKRPTSKDNRNRYRRKKSKDIIGKSQLTSLSQFDSGENDFSFG